MPGGGLWRSGPARRGSGKAVLSPQAPVAGRNDLRPGGQRKGPHAPGDEPGGGGGADRPHAGDSGGVLPGEHGPGLGPAVPGRRPGRGAPGFDRDDEGHLPQAPPGGGQEPAFGAGGRAVHEAGGAAALWGAGHGAGDSL